MKFDCGLPKQERRQALLEWHPYFAWLPIRVGRNECRWLETVERKVGHIGPLYGTLFDVQYRARGSR